MKAALELEQQSCGNNQVHFERGKSDLTWHGSRGTTDQLRTLPLAKRASQAARSAGLGARVPSRSQKARSLSVTGGSAAGRLAVISRALSRMVQADNRLDELLAIVGARGPGGNSDVAPPAMRPGDEQLPTPLAARLLL